MKKSRWQNGEGRELYAVCNLDGPGASGGRYRDDPAFSDGKMREEKMGDFAQMYVHMDDCGHGDSGNPDDLRCVRPG